MQRRMASTYSFGTANRWRHWILLWDCTNVHCDRKKQVWKILINTVSGVNIKIASPIQKKASETETKNAQLWIERWFLLYQLFYPPSNCDTVCTIIVFKIKPRFAWLWLVREFTCEIIFKRYCLYMFMYVTFFSIYQFV